MAITKNYTVENQNIFIFKDKDVLVEKNSDKSLLLSSKHLFEVLKNNELFEIDFYDSCMNVIGAELKIDSDISKFLQNESYEFIPVREYFFMNSEEDASLCARIKSYANWLKSTRFCCSCGSKLDLFDKENALYCSNCKKIHYPRIEPCIILLIHKDDKVLMLRHTYRNQDKFTCLAGFMEVGESVEQCVYREVMEEVGLEITNLRYMGSQGWPFPDQLMLAFYADYKSGDIKLQESEISEAKWLDPKDLQNPPLPGSVAWRLVNHKF